MEIENTVVVVTGGASGIGKALVERFLAEGARHVVAADLDGAGARAVAEALGAPDRVQGVALDVTDEDALVALIDRIEADVGPIDIFCSNAGIGAGRDVDTPNDVWERIWHVNTMAHVYAARHLIPRMKARGGGYLVNTASAAGLLSQIGSVTYAVTKHAAVALAEWLSITHGDDGIRVSVLCPQAVDTPMIANTEDGGVAGVDGLVSPAWVAECVMEGIRDERFLILPHPEVAEYVKRKGDDRDRWLRGMRKLQARYAGKAV